MSVVAAKSASVWIETGPPQPQLPILEQDVRADVAVLGGGIVGITLALLLAEAGVQVVLLEANQLARGVSGYTTAKVSLPARADLRAPAFAASAPRPRASTARPTRRRWPGSPGGSSRTGSTATSVASPPMPTSRRAPSARRSRRRWRRPSRRGCPPASPRPTPLPYPVEAAVRFEDQAEFHVRKYLLALAEQLPGDRCQVYENSHAVEVDADEHCVVKTPGGRVTADQVVVATHYPFLDRSLAFARVHPQRSYALACRIDGQPPEGMHISGDSPTRSVRAIPLDGRGAAAGRRRGPQAGRPAATPSSATGASSSSPASTGTCARSTTAGRRRTPSRSTALPYVGPLTPRSDRVCMATGFASGGSPTAPPRR